MNDTTVLWRAGAAGDEIACLMISCCSGAELQVQRADTIVLRELYPDKSTLYERARQLRADWEATGSGIGDLGSSGRPKEP